RDAILTADAIFYANAHRCLLWQAFAGRGMGYGASQGSANSIADETVSFAMPPFCLPPTQIPVAAFTSDSTTILCGHKVKFTDQSIQAFSWLWDFGDQSSSTLQHPTHIFTSPGTYSVKLKVLNPLGADSVIHTIVVTAAFSATVSASPLSVCGGATVTLNANASGSTNRSYTVTSIPFAPFTGSFTNISLTDDQMSSSLPIGFTFNFYGTNYTNFYICSNGFITFSPSMPASIVYGEYLPTSSIPNNLIALSWNDLNPQNAGSTIGYTTTGTAPNRKLIIQYNTSHYQSASMPFVVQAILYEGSNLIEIHTTSISNMSAIDFDAVTTQGVENVDGSKAVAVSGRNSSHFSATNDAYRFTPVIPYTYNWLPGNLPGANQNAQPLVNTTYTVQVSDGTACTVNYSTSPVVIVPCSTTISLHVLLQGYYAGAGEMRPVLLNQGVSTNNLLCDTITVELHSSSAPYNMLQTQKTVLQKNGTATVVWNVLPGPYYLVVKHRSSLETWSSVPVWLNSTGTLYDFTDAMTKAYGNNLADMGASLWAIYAGDIVKDENVDLLDYITIEADIVGFGSGYMATDINGDGNVDLLDIPVMEENINNFIYSNHP
ncbi:MAG TPA: PKD domain-containing protein, partial [Chitinophagaceae bacterium]|nr:PKD domain-containing protein [Chitinophagaceae bacterium]